MGFHTGQRVRCTNQSGWFDEVEGLCGTIREVCVEEEESGVIGVEFDNFTEGHNLSMHGYKCPEGKGFYVSEDDLIPLDNLISVEELI